MEKDTLLSQNTNGRMGKDICNIYDRRHINILHWTPTKTNPIEKMGRAYEFQLTEKEIQRADKYMERCSTLY